MEKHGVKTTREHWDATHAVAPRMRLPSPLLVSTRDIQRLLRKHIKPCMRVLEIGCAPGKQLAYVSKVLGAKVSGIDYSTVGIGYTHKLFSALDIDGDVRCEDMFNSSFPSDSFDVVYSIGVVEHFEDPRHLIEIHTELLCQGGTALIAIPNYGGIYGRLQDHFNPENLSIHNLDMMQIDSFRSLAPRGDFSNIEVFSYGRFNPWLISWERKMPAIVAKILCMVGNFTALLQPFNITTISPMLVLKITR